MAFSKKHVPWNKGMKGLRLSPYSGFKKGMTPWNAGKAILGVCADCGKKSRWIKEQAFCHKCWWARVKIDKSLHPRWKTDRSEVVKSEHKHLDGNYKLWMQGVKTRDNWKCKILNNDCEGRLEAHHILSWKEYPELRYDVNNGITLCHAHHPRKRSEEKRLQAEFQALVSASKV